MLLERSDCTTIKSIKPVISGLSKDGFLFPVVLTEDFIESSLDSFPLEFLEFKTYHKMVVGSSPFEKRTPDIRNIRLQCERELKGKVLHLKTALLNVKEAKSFRELVKFSIEDLCRISIGLLVLQGVKAPLLPSELPMQMADVYGLDKDVISAVIAGNFSDKEIMPLFEKYLSLFDGLAERIDQGE